MEGNFFEQSFDVRYYETVGNGELGIINLMNYFEEVALLQSEKCNVGFKYYMENYVIWMLHKWNISIFQYPVFGQQIRIQTLPDSVSGFMGYRKFWVYDTNGTTMASADSAWIFLNTQTKRPARINDDMKHAYGHFGKPDAKMEFPLVATVNNPAYRKTFEVQKSDIDMNNHVHNTRYVHWALETLPEDFLRENRLVNLVVEYKKETTLGQVIASEAEILAENGITVCVHQISNRGNNTACVLSTQWVNRGIRPNYL